MEFDLIKTGQVFYQILNLKKTFIIIDNKDDDYIDLTFVRINSIGVTIAEGILYDRNDWLTYTRRVDFKLINNSKNIQKKEIIFSLFSLEIDFA